jgi:hypothetical protein
MFQDTFFLNSSKMTLSSLLSLPKFLTIISREMKLLSGDTLS